MGKHVFLGFKSVDLIIKYVYLKLNWSIYFGETADLGKTVDLLKTEYLCRFEIFGPNFIIVYPIHSFQDHMTWFYHCVPNSLLSRPFALILPLCTQLLLSRPYDLIFPLSTLLTPFKTIWTDFTIVYTIDSFEDHST